MRTRIGRIIAVLELAIFLSSTTLGADNFGYTNDHGTLTITGYAGLGGTVMIPESINGLPLIGIGDYAFFWNSCISNLVIPKGVTFIGDHAFNLCSVLLAIDVDQANLAFSSVEGVLFNKIKSTLICCPGGRIGSYSIPQGVTNIGNEAFGTCFKLTGVTIPSGILGIGRAAFSGCSVLTNISLPNTVITIGRGAFNGCQKLMTLTIPESVTHLENPLFQSDAKLNSINVDPLNKFYSSKEGVLFNKDQTTLIEYPAGKSGAYIIPNGVTSIMDHAFYSCSNLTSIIIPKDVTCIGSAAFSCCVNLTNLIIPNRVTSIGESAFDHCTNLTGVIIPNGVTSIGSDTFYYCLSLTNLIIPNSVTSIGESAFGYCTNLANLTIPSSVTNIGSGAFLSCSSLISAAIPNGVTSIRDYTFGNCTKLTTVTIPNSVTNIGTTAFSYCFSLTKIIIPKSVWYVGASAFVGCQSLTSVYFEGNAPQYYSDWGAIPIYQLPEFELINTTVYYLPGTVGWNSTWSNVPTAPWFRPNPTILPTAASFGIQTNQFGFRISWATNTTVVVECCPTLANPVWSPVSTNTLVDGWIDFSDAQWRKYPERFYRVHSL